MDLTAAMCTPHGRQLLTTASAKSRQWETNFGESIKQGEEEGYKEGVSQRI